MFQEVIYVKCQIFWSFKETSLWGNKYLMIKHDVYRMTSVQFSSVQSLSHVRFFVIPWTAACQDSLSITNSWSWLKLMSIESVMPSNHLILCRPLLLPSIFPSIWVFSNQSVLCIRSKSIGASASASVLPMNIQDWFPLDLISLQSRGSQESSLTSQFKSMNSALSFPYIPTFTSIHDYWKNHSFD